MSDVIHLLPDTVANQIAAGEVVQRPASVIKELVENSIDAGATSIKVLIKDAGKTLIQVIDNGKGMSETDARLCFERHATSKIQSAEDLFALHTMGFRGEALPSISSVAQVELKTKRKEDEVGTLIEISGGKIDRQESVSASDGTNISVKNLFFNVPARRKFLKTNSTEFGHIETEFFRIALVNPQVELSLYHNDQLCYQLRSGSIRERIVGVYGKPINAQLLPIQVDSTIVKISGFIGKPETAKKQNSQQYFFVNGRYMRHPYFHKAVVQAFERFLQPATSPSYFIYFEVDPAGIDVNIHPTKTEIKFENEQTIWPILLAGVKESLGKFNIVPSIDFDQEEDVLAASFAPSLTPSDHPITELPKMNLDLSYNPFNQPSSGGYSSGTSSHARRENTTNWESLYEGFEQAKAPVFTSSGFREDADLVWQDDQELLSLDLDMGQSDATSHYLQLKEKYILTVMRSGLVCIDQHRAHVQVLYAQYVRNIQQQKGASQRLLFPVMMEVLESDAMLLDELGEQLSYVGFELSNLGHGTFSISGIPVDCKESAAKDYLLDLLQTVKEGGDVKDNWTTKIALKLAESAAIPSGKSLTEEEMMKLVSQLFSLPNPEESVDNKTVMTIIAPEELDKRFK